MSNLVGKTLLDRYHVQEFLGRGGMAEVYKVWDNHRMIHLAIKVLHEDLAVDRVFMRRFEREASVLEKLQHPNIVRYYGLEQEGRLAFMVLDYIDGESLKPKIFDANGPYPIEDTRRIIRAVSGALAFAHREGFVHCDIKPANILVTDDGQALLSDFGISRMTDAATATMVGIGTPAYMAPEQIKGEDPVPATDIYAMGILLFELLTGGERPFTGESATTTGSTSERVRWEQINMPPPSPKKWNKKLSLQIEKVVMKALEKEIDQRYQTSIDLLNAFENAMGGSSPESSETIETERIDKQKEQQEQIGTDGEEAETILMQNEFINEEILDQPRNKLQEIRKSTWFKWAAGALILLFMFFLYSIGKDSPTKFNNVQSGPIEIPADEPAADGPAFDYPFKNPDTYVYVTYGEPESMDPHWTYETSGSGIQNNVYESLIWFNRERTDSFVPILATEWKANAAGDVWTFIIREGVTFHAGGTLEPHDVAYSMQRALLQDRNSGPHWMTHEVFFGTYSMYGGTADKYYGGAGNMTDADYVGACEYVKKSIVANDAADTVTFTLASPAPWFLALLANNFVGNVLDQEWMTDNGGWDGDCATWQDFTDPAAEESILFNAANGTGPYVFDHWTPGEEIVLTANKNYWRADDDPIWEGGPAGVARIKRFVSLFVNEWGTRLAMLEAGDADFIAAPSQFNSQVEPYYGTIECVDPDHKSCVEVAEDGWIQAYVGIQRPVMTPAQFNQAINDEGGNVFLGSGKLDGNGITPDFFTDVHVRRAFSYCFDYERMIAEALDGEGSQAQGPIIADMLGYRYDGFVYSYDPAKCEEEFKLSDTGVWDTGFYFQIGYNTGNEGRRLAAEVIKAGIESVNPKFQMTVVGMPWPELLNTRRAGKLPIYVGGWVEDFHDPHNWVHPFLHSQGAYGRVANIQEPLSSELDDLIDLGAALTDTEIRRQIYEEIQLKAQEEAVMIWMYQPLVRYHFSPWIEGWYFNAAYPSPANSYIYALDKVRP